MVCVILVFGSDFFTEEGHRVPYEQMCHVFGHGCLDSLAQKVLVDLLVMDKLFVVVALVVIHALGDVAGHRAISGLGDLTILGPFRIGRNGGLASLFFGPAINQVWSVN